MNVITVDDKQPIVLDMLNKLQTADGVENALGFTDPYEALECVKRTIIDIAFLDVEMPLMGGVELAKKIKEISPHTKIIFLTGFGKYALDAFEVRATGFLVKPVRREKLLSEIEHIKTLLPIAPKYRIKVQTFNGFEIFVDGIPVLFARAKSKELLAILVDKNGASASMRELIATLWEDKPYSATQKSHFHSVLAEMLRALGDANAASIIVKKRNSFAVALGSFECDYYNLLKNEPDAVAAFTGNYMPKYSWAEETAAVLSTKVNR